MEGISFFMAPSFGKVYLVGAGPGDPGLITVRGRECLERADVVVFDALANDALLRHAANAEHIFVGKSTDKHTLLQEEINALLVTQARKHAVVVRLKGGDPFVFGRGGEEALHLAQNGVPFEVVPGVTAGVAAPAYAGIPVTHRGMAASCAFITGHIPPGEPGAVDLARIGLEGTLCFYMAVRNLPAICSQLVELGRSPDTPAAVIAWGTCPQQRTATGTLATIAGIVEREGIVPPALFVVGEVASLADTLAWHDQRPLFGLRIAVTRAQSQASKLVASLRQLGADVFEFPTIAIEFPEEPQPFDPLSTYDWVVLTSVNAVESLFTRLAERGEDARAFAGVKICVIGSATGEAVRQRFLEPDLVPERYVAEELMTALHAFEQDLAGKRFLLPRADIARGFLPAELRAQGAEVTELVAYRTVPPEASSERCEALLAFAPDLVTFTSSSTARNFAQLMGARRLKDLDALGVAYASIGPLTTETAESLGMPVATTADTHDIPGLVEALTRWATQPRMRQRLEHRRDDPATGSQAHPGVSFTDVD